MSTSPPAERPITERALVGALWVVLLAAIVSLFPFTIYSTLLVPIAAASGTDEALAGALRGLGGVSAVLVGIGLAPVLARWSRPHTIGVSLAVLAGSCLIGATASLPGLVVFCLGIGASTAVLTPTLLATATSVFPAAPDAGRAATIVTATQSLAAVLAGPVIGALAWWQGWRGALVITTGVALATAALSVALPPQGSGRRTAITMSYLTGFRQLWSRPDLMATVMIAALRTTSFMGYLAFLAVQYHQRFGLDPGTFTLVWTLSGASFFTGNYLAGRWARSSADRVRRTRAVLVLGLVSGVAAVVVVFTTHHLGVALAATAVMGVGHAVVAAQVTVLLATRAGDLTPLAFSVNASGMSLGVFTGAVLGGLGLAAASSTGLAVALAVPSIIALLWVPAATRTGPDPSA